MPAGVQMQRTGARWGGSTARARISPAESLRGAGLLPGATLAGDGQITNGRIRLRVPTTGKPAIEQMKVLFLDQVELTLMGFSAMPVRGQRYRGGQPGLLDCSAW